MILTLHSREENFSFGSVKKNWREGGEYSFPGCWCSQLVRLGAAGHGSPARGPAQPIQVGRATRRRLWVWKGILFTLRSI